MLKFQKVKKENLEQILKWRTLPEVTRYMYSDIKYDIEDQKKWFKKLSTNKNQKAWIISYESQNIGTISLNNIDYRNKHCSWGYYIGEQNKRGIGGIIPPYIYNFVFLEMEFNKIIAEVMDGNEKIMKMHEMHGYRFIGKYNNHIYKYDKYHDIFVYELLSETWTSIKKYKNYVASFEL